MSIYDFVAENGSGLDYNTSVMVGAMGRFLDLPINIKHLSDPSSMLMHDREGNLLGTLTQTSDTALTRVSLTTTMELPPNVIGHIETGLKQLVDSHYRQS